MSTLRNPLYDRAYIRTDRIGFPPIRRLAIELDSEIPAPVAPERTPRVGPNGSFLLIDQQ